MYLEYLLGIKNAWTCIDLKSQKSVREMIWLCVQPLCVFVCVTGCVCVFVTLTCSHHKCHHHSFSFCSDFQPFLSLICIPALQLGLWLKWSTAGQNNHKSIMFKSNWHDFKCIRTYRLFLKKQNKQKVKKKWHDFCFETNPCIF